jgi:hypothetical protein
MHGGAAPLPREEKQPQVYTETQRERFHERVRALSLRALSSAHIPKSSRNGVFEISVPNENAEELIRQALQGQR